MTARNRTPDRYRDVSVADVDVPLTAAALSELLLGRDAYRRTTFIVVRRGSETALVEIEKASTDPLFSPITAVRLLAGPVSARSWTPPISTPRSRRTSPPQRAGCRRRRAV